jgi:hypothetical protein
VLFEECPEHARVAFPHLPQHPPARLVNEIVLVAEEKLRHPERVLEPVLPN